MSDSTEDFWDFVKRTAEEVKNWPEWKKAAAEREMGQPIQEEPNKKSAIFWTTRDGRKLSVSDMTTEHIVNTIWMLQRIAIAKCRQQGFPLSAQLVTRHPMFRVLRDELSSRNKDPKEFLYSKEEQEMLFNEADAGIFAEEKEEKPTRESHQMKRFRALLK